MPKLLTVKLFIVGLILVGASAEAEETISSSTSSTTIETAAPDQKTSSSTGRQTTLQQNRTERQEMRDERQSALSLQRQQRVINLAANVSNRMDAAIERLYTILERFESRITKMKATGIDTTMAEAELRSASQHLATARATLATIDNAVQTATSATDPQNRWQVVKTTYHAAGESIRASHQALRTTLSLLRSAGVIPNTETSTSTATTSE